jgi:type IV secretion system protein VirD4
MKDEEKKLGNKIKRKIKQIKEFVMKHPVKIVLSIIVLLYVSGIMSEALYQAIHFGEIRNGNGIPWYMLSWGPKAMLQWCTSVRGFICLLLTIVAAYLLWIYGVKPRVKEETGKDNIDIPFKYSEEKPYGSAEKMTEEDLEDILEFKPIEETHGIILGQTYDGKVVSIPTSEEFEEKAKRKNWSRDDMTNNTRNRNILAIGSPGTMKTRALIMNQVFQAIVHGDSIMITDPKGEIYEKTYNRLKENGYDVRMFNLIKQDHSDSWNPINELKVEDYDTFNPIEILRNSSDKTQRKVISSVYAKIFASTIVNNADENGEKYWSDNAMNVLKSCLMLKDMDSLGKIYDFISRSTIEQLALKFSDADDESVARRAFDIFNQSSETVKGQIINGLGIMIDVFQDERIRNMTGSSEIDMTKPAKEKCAYFVITSDQHRTFDYLAVLFWTMAFIKLIEYIDENRDEKGDPTTLPIHMLLDEFPNIGEIPDFNRKLSVVRSRLIYTTIIIQNLPQLMNRYPNGMHEEIFSDCDFTVFLGCNDYTTAEYISKLTGIASIEVTTQNSTYARNVMVLNQDPNFKEVKSIGQRTVMNADEVKSIKNTDLLIFIRGTKSVYQCKKFDYSKHPFAKDLKIAKIKDYVPEWKQQLIDDAKEQIRRNEERLKKEAEEKERERLIQEKAIERENRRKEMMKQDEDDFFEGFTQQAINFDDYLQNKKIANKEDFINTEDESENEIKLITEKQTLDEINTNENDIFSTLLGDEEDTIPNLTNSKNKSTNKKDTKSKNEKKIISRNTMQNKLNAISKSLDKIEDENVELDIKKEAEDIFGNFDFSNNNDN